MKSIVNHFTLLRIRLYQYSRVYERVESFYFLRVFLEHMKNPLKIEEVEILTASPLLKEQEKSLY